MIGVGIEHNSVDEALKGKAEESSLTLNFKPT